MLGTRLDVPSVFCIGSRASGVCPACFVINSLGGPSGNEGRESVPSETSDADDDSCAMPPVATDGARLFCRKFMPSNVLLFPSGIFGFGMLVIGLVKDKLPVSRGGTFSDMLGRCWLRPIVPRQNSFPVLAGLELEAVERPKLPLPEILVSVGAIA